MTLIALLRHAPTAWNVERRMQGRRDLALTPAAQADYAIRRIPDSCPRFRVFSSPLSRARQTAALLGLAATVEPRLVEMDWGRYEGRTIAALREDPGFALNESRGLDFQPPGGESPRTVQARLKPLLAEIAASHEPTLCVTHRGVIRAVYALARDWPMVGRPPDKLAPDALQIFALDDAGRPSIAQLNVALVPR
jgi:probable phosphoglycerate mutase